MDNASVHILCEAIMVQAAADYRKLRRGGKVPCENMESVMDFFYSDWAKLICRKADPIAIFQRLQRECES